MGEETKGRDWWFIGGVLVSLICITLVCVGAVLS